MPIISSPVVSTCRDPSARRRPASRRYLFTRDRRHRGLRAERRRTGTAVPVLEPAAAVSRASARAGSIGSIPLAPQRCVRWRGTLGRELERSEFRQRCSFFSIWPSSRRGGPSRPHKGCSRDPTGDSPDRTNARVRWHDGELSSPARYPSRECIRGRLLPCRLVPGAAGIWRSLRSAVTGRRLAKGRLLRACT
jgi:hypothetical protein